MLEYMVGEPGADVVRRNGFYESCDLFSPALLSRFLADRLKREATLVHSAGGLFGYTMLSGYVPILEGPASLGIDSLLCPDVFLRGGDAHLQADTMGATTTLHMPYERPDEVRKAVRHVFEVFGTTGLIVTPCSTAKAVFPRENVLAMIDEWRALR
jgi:hypothetical protein